MTDLTLAFDEQILALATQESIVCSLDEEVKQKLVEATIEDILRGD